MVSLWPWKGEDNSPASFEKALKVLAEKIAKSQTQLSSLQQQSRRTKALWTLYTSFAYLLCFIILFLVVGWQNWTALEYTAVSGSPLIIWIIRTLIAWYYTYRIDNATHRLEAQQGERTKTIQKLKAATKFDSTQELLEKYGGEKPKPKPKKETDTPSKGPKGPKGAPKIPSGRTSIGPPPPTANIRGPMLVQSQPSTPQPISRTPPNYMIPSPVSASGPVGQAEFAPNAFSSPPQYANQNEFEAGGHWYDRILDVLMGEDETLPRNRTALICQNCRLVNGQAPPGTKSLAELGKWKCFGCHAMNGEDEAVKIVQEMKERVEETGTETETEDRAVSSPAENKVLSLPENKVSSAETEKQVKEEHSDDDLEVVDEPADGPESGEDTIEVLKPKRGRPKGSRTKT